MHPTDVVYGGCGVVSFRTCRGEVAGISEDFVAAVIAEEA